MADADAAVQAADESPESAPDSLDAAVAGLSAAVEAEAARDEAAAPAADLKAAASAAVPAEPPPEEARARAEAADAAEVAARAAAELAQARARAEAADAAEVAARAAAELAQAEELAATQRAAVEAASTQARAAARKAEAAAQAASELAEDNSSEPAYLDAEQVRQLQTQVQFDHRRWSMPAMQRMALVSGARLDLDQESQARRGRAQSETAVTVTADCPLRARRAKKYLRLQRFSRTCLVPEHSVRDDGDLTVMEVPESSWADMERRGGRWLNELSEDCNVFAYRVAVTSTPASSSTKSATAKALVTWLEAGSRVEVRKSGDIRSNDWQLGTVKALSHKGITTILDGGQEVVTEAEKVRPFFDVEAAVELCSTGGSSWRAARVAREWEGRHLRVRLESTGTSEEPEEELEVEIGQVRPRRSKTATAEADMAEAAAEEAQQTEENLCRVAIFGELQARCDAQLRLMGKVDERTPGYYSNKTIDWGSAKDADWGESRLELGEAAAELRNMRKRLRSASGCVVLQLGTTAYAVGPSKQRQLACALIEVLRSCKRGFVKEVPADLEEYCTRLEVPQGSNLTSDKQRERLELQERCVTLILGTEAEEKAAGEGTAEDEKAPEAKTTALEDGQKAAAEDEAAEENDEDARSESKDGAKKDPVDGAPEEETETKTVEAVAEEEKEEAENPPAEDGAEEEKAALPPTTLLIFAFSERARECMQLRMQDIVEKDHAGYYSSSWAIEESIEEGFARDVLEMPEDMVGWATGAKGANRRKLEGAAGCLMCYMGGAHRVAILGTRSERARARTYLDWHLAQSVGVKNRSKHIPLKLSQAELQARDDVNIVEVSSKVVDTLDFDSLRSIEAETSTVIHVREVSSAELFKTGSCMTLTRGGRTFHAEVVTVSGSDEAGESLCVQLRVLETGAAAAKASGDEEANAMQILIFGHDQGLNGYCGRSLAERKVRELISSNPKRGQADVDATAVASDSGPQRSWQGGYDKSGKDAGWHQGGRSWSSWTASQSASKPRDDGGWHGASEAKNSNSKDGGWDQWNPSLASSSGNQRHRQESGGNESWGGSKAATGWGAVSGSSQAPRWDSKQGGGTNTSTQSAYGSSGSAELGGVAHRTWNSKSYTASQSADTSGSADVSGHSRANGGAVTKDSNLLWDNWRGSDKTSKPERARSAPRRRNKSQDPSTHRARHTDGNSDSRTGNWGW
eukprot:TRINITY_DN8406_c0_g1_i1.p1 TRINITY_DN8406_c0_g1~~TRINITY_DN8406_c0_g1_i1.p1  ORF type:complete len:1217 (+),score=282.83 TRINITY_DN8406_c0_g1_i1:32-3652(+)